MSFLTAATLCLSVIVLMDSCKGNRSSSGRNYSSPQDVKRDPAQEYNLIIDKTYYTIDSAIGDIDRFISSFGSESEARNYVDDLQEIRSELKSMDKFLSKDFYSPRNFKDECEEVADRYENSDWSIVQDLWDKLQESKYNAVLQKTLDNIDEDTFRSYMISDAEKRCLENYEAAGPFGIGYMLSRSRSTEVVSISTPEEVDGLAAKRAEGIIRVHMEGSLGMGHRIGSVKLRIKGQLGITTNGDIQYNSIDYDIVERTGSLQ